MCTSVYKVRQIARRLVSESNSNRMKNVCSSGISIVVLLVLNLAIPAFVSRVSAEAPSCPASNLKPESVVCNTPRAWRRLLVG